MTRMKSCTNDDDVRQKLKTADVDAGDLKGGAIVHLNGSVQVSAQLLQVNIVQMRANKSG